jgi:hypothetical protein
MRELRSGGCGRRAFGLGVAAALTGCAGADADGRRVALAPGVAFALPAPAALGRSVDAAQLIEARHGERTLAFEGRLSVTPERLRLVGTDMLGRRALSADWDGTRLGIETASWLPSALRPANMIGDIMLLFWPEDVVRLALAPAGATLTEEPRSRLVRAGTRQIARIDYTPDRARAWRGQARYENFGWGYALVIRSTEIAA